MSTIPSDKILVSGDVNGNLSLLFKRISTVNSKSGPFSLLLCVGEFFKPDQNDWEQYKTGKLKVPIPTYVLGPSNPDTEKYFTDKSGFELTENLIYLGSSGIYSCRSGLKIAYLSGRDCLSYGSSARNFGYTLSDVKKLELAAGNNPQVDILITSDWPKGVCKFAKPPDGIDAETVGCLLISRLAQTLKPRYHFVGTDGVYYERLPYRNHEVLQELSHNVTRFIALAKVGNLQKQKWLYAFNTVPIVHSNPADLAFQPPDVTEHPYPKDIVIQSEQLYSKRGNEGQQFFYDMKSPNSSDDRNSYKKRKNKFDRKSFDGVKRKPPELNAPCWFCLASADVEKHLVVSVGTYCYLALAKGGLVQDHLLILPIEHFQSSANVDEDCIKEIERFKLSLQDMFKKIGKAPVFFERNYRTQHLQIQVVPVPFTFTEHLKSSFLDISESSGIRLDEVPQFSDLAQLAPPGTPFFFIQLPSGEKLFHRIQKGFPLNFGRELLACPPLLNCPERIDWRECKLSVDQETQIRDAIREAFKPFDFTLEDDSDSSDD